MRLLKLPEQKSMDEALLAESLVRLRLDFDLGLNLHDLRLTR